MIRAALFVCAGLLGFAADASAACDIAAKVAELRPGFSPAHYGNCAPGLACNYNDPTQFIANPPSPSLGGAVAVIAAAYNAAPPFFQAALCRLDHIYVDTDTLDPAKPSVWGMRERLFLDPATKQARAHIGISAQLLAALARQRVPYAAYENLLAQALLGSAPGTLAAGFRGLSYMASPDPAAGHPAAIAVLAILAHEMGHIVWWQRDVGDSAFPQFSWTGKSVQHGFHDFGVEDPANAPRRHPVKADVQYSLRYFAVARGAADLRQVYGGEWASLFATVAADEDFVETYKLIVLTDNTTPTPTRQVLTALKVTIPEAGSADILANLNNPAAKLHEKASWVRELLALR